jgi:RND family efflux transporter MFP subunit
MRFASDRRAVFIVPLIGLALGGCGRGGSESDAVSGETIAVTVQAARLGSLRDVVSASGTVVPATVADFIVTASEPAEIVELPKNEGDAVKAGDVLVRLEVPSVTNEVATRQLEFSEAASRLEAARTDEARLESLVNQGLAARNKLESARLARTTAEAALSQVRARLESAKALESGAVIRARFPGVVIKRWHAQGDRVAGGEADPILRVIDPARLQIALQIPPAQADRINQGQAASVQTGAGTEPAVVAMKAAPTGDTTTTIEVRLNLASVTPLALDAIVQAEIVLEELQNVLLVPAGAVQQGEKGSFVWLASDTGQAVKRDVRAGLTALGQTQIVSGLNPDDKVIITGIAQLSEGAPITISR